MIYEEAIASLVEELEGIAEMYRENKESGVAMYTEDDINRKRIEYQGMAHFVGKMFGKTQNEVLMDAHKASVSETASVQKTIEVRAPYSLIIDLRNAYRDAYHATYKEHFEDTATVEVIKQMRLETFNTMCGKFCEEYGFEHEDVIYALENWQR